VLTHPALQKPSSAKPTQLNANKPQAAAATEANVAIVFVSGMMENLCTLLLHSDWRSQPKDGGKMFARNNRALWRPRNIRLPLARKNP
jgi:hypothetical protein